MILVDVNLLLYAYVQRYAEHPKAKEWLDRVLSGHARVGLPWVSLISFVRMVTNPRMFERAESTVEAWRQVQAWLASEVAWIPQPGERHAEVLGKFLALPGIHGTLVPDAHLAALAMEHGLTLCSADRDFARFPGLRWLNPLAE